MRSLDPCSRLRPGGHTQPRVSCSSRQILGPSGQDFEAFLYCQYTTGNIGPRVRLNEEPYLASIRNQLA